MKDWKGNAKSIFAQLGASSHSSDERQSQDYYATDPMAAELLQQIEDIPKDKPVWECAAGERHLRMFSKRPDIRCTLPTLLNAPKM